MKTLASLLALLSLASCASFSTAERACIVASVADVATTLHGIENGAREANPALTLAGEDAATVAVTRGLFTLGWISLTRSIARKNPKQAKALNWTCAGAGFGASAWNLSVVSEKETP